MSNAGCTGTLNSTSYVDQIAEVRGEKSTNSGEVQVAKKASPIAKAGRREFELAFGGENLGEVGAAAEVQVGFLLDAIEDGERFEMLMLGLGAIAGEVGDSGEQVVRVRDQLGGA